ncbi:two-component regulator propeller domain-containing protein [Flavobacteriaceae bacterium MHTCC 0001]
MPVYWLEKLSMSLRNCFLVFVVISVNLWSQSGNNTFKFVNIKEGISKVGVSTINQDHYGFIWIGTRGTGLYKFDGINYTAYKHGVQDSTSLSNNRVLCSLFDSKNRLWVGTESGLNLYDRNLDKFDRVIADTSNPFNENILTIEEGSANNLLVGTNGDGCFKLNLQNFKTESILPDTSLVNAGGLVVNSIKHFTDGTTFLGTNIGLLEYDEAKNVLVRSQELSENKSIIQDPVSKLFIDNENNLWVGTSTNGIYKCQVINNKSILKIEHFSYTNKRILDFVQSTNETLICSSENDGLFHFATNGELIKNYRSSKKEESSILHNSVWSLFKDGNNRIWLGYYNSGVAVCDQLYDKFKDIKSLPNKDNSLTIGSVTGIVKDASGKLWIAMDGGGIDVYNPENQNITHINVADSNIYSGLNSDYIVSLFKDSKENIWAGSWDNGVFVLKKGEKKFINLSSLQLFGQQSPNVITSFAEDANGIIWIGTFSEGIYSYNPSSKTLRNYNSGNFVSNGINSALIRKILIDSQGVMWVASNTGLFKIEQLQEGNFKITPFNGRLAEKYGNPANANTIVSVYECTNGHIWIGTKGAGLCKYDKSKDELHWYNSSNGFDEENVLAITEDNKGHLWVSGNSGLTRIDVDKLTFSNYTHNDGLLSNNFNYNAVLKDSDNILYFGNYIGVDYFNPDNLPLNTSPLSLYLTDFKLFNKKISPATHTSLLQKVISETDSIVLRPNQSVFTIDYSGINYTRPEKNSYAYYLEGYEYTWNYVGQQRSATYTNLDPGYYTFKLIGANNDGVWNEEPLRLKITVLPPWWRTKWAIFFYVLLFFLSLYLLNYFTQRRIKEKELINNERIQQIQQDELNKRKIQFFTNISHEFRTPLTLIISPLKDIINNKDLNLPQSVKNKLAIVYKNTDRLYRLINELMDLRKLGMGKMNIKVEEIDLIYFTKNIANYFHEEAESKNIYLSVDADDPNLTIWADKRMLEKILFNLLSNAIKFTPEGGTIGIELFAGQSYLLPLISEDEKVEAIKIKISDSGPGLEKDQLDKIFDRFYQVEGQNKTYFGGTGIGLEVVQSFVNLHKGKVEVASDLGVGTTFKLLFPSGKNHFAEDEIIKSKDLVEPNHQGYLINAIQKDIVSEVDEDVKLQKQHTLLVVEDNVELREYLNLELSNQYKILLASNGKEGVKIAREFFPDVILTDVIMPEMNGFEFCKIIKTDPSTSHIPLLMLTAKATIENRIEGIETGADAYMVKPFDLKLLKLRLSQLITSRQLIFDKYFGAISGSEENANTTSLDKEFIEKLLNYINDNIGNSSLSVEELAEQFNLSRSQLYRKIKALTGQTVNEFIRKIRLERAKQILEKGSMNISETCFSVGFSSPSYFAKCFKTHFGILPTEVEVE